MPWIAAPPLVCGEVHIWRFALTRARDDLHELGQLLAPVEQERVARLRFPYLRDDAIAARGLLRRILSGYAGTDPADLVFEYGPQGKPFLAGTPVHFNLSHSGGWGLCAVAVDRPVGVDVELIRADLDHAALARHSFSADERASLVSYPPGSAMSGFFRCWTFKEAYIKGRGGGLSIPLEDFDVPLGPDFEHQPVRSRETPSADTAGWFVRELHVSPHVAAAVAMQAREFRVRCLRWPD